MDFNCELRYLMKLSDKFEIKLFILLLLDGIGVPLEFEVINDIVLRDGVVTYFDFADAFGDLCDNGLIEYTEQPDGSGKTYSVTPKGHAITEGLDTKLYGQIKEKAIRSAQRAMAFRLSGGSTSASVQQTDDGYNVVCSITENGKLLFSTTVFVRSAAYAERLRDRFDEEPETVYKGVLALLSGDVDYLFE